MQPTPTNPQPDPHRQALDDLIAIGVNLARHLQAQATGPYPILHDYAAESFERISRAVRRTILLARRLEAHPAPNPPTRPQDPQGPREPRDPTPPHTHPDGRPDSRDSAETPDRPESLEDEDDDATADDQALAALTNAQALALIRRDLGLTLDAPPNPDAPPAPEDHPTPPNDEPPLFLHPGPEPYDLARPPSRIRISARNYPPIHPKQTRKPPPRHPRTP